ncbi:MAG: mechanosensitive ion channel family protein [Planctomycetia bacterium]|nr:mechanosensitive ion channel family protein [Planctomycetia bacterium]
MLRKIIYGSFTVILLATVVMVSWQYRQDRWKTAAADDEVAKTEVYTPDAVPKEMKPKESIVPEEVAEASAEVEGASKATAAGKSPEDSALDAVVIPQAVEPAKAVDAKVVRGVRHLSSPKATIEYFMTSTRSHRYEDAVVAMDFSLLPELRKVQKQHYAFRLAGILRRLDNFNPASLPDDFDEKECCLWPDQNYSAIVLTRHNDGTWRFSPETVQDIPRFFKQIESKLPVFVQQGWLKNFPQWAFCDVAGLAVLQWGFLAGFVFLGCMASFLIPVISSSIIFFIMRISKVKDTYSHLMHRAIQPFGSMAMIYIWYLGLDFIQVSPAVTRVAELTLQPLCLVFVMVSLIRFVDIFSVWLNSKIKNSSNKIKAVLVHLSSGVLKFLIIGLGCIEIAKIYGFSAIGILSGMGIGGIAVALAAQHTISNFFGSLTILIDKPFTIGDYIVVDGIEGKIETVGLRSTRIRTFYGSRIFVPNDHLAGSIIDNMGHREYRRFKTVLGLQYDTPVMLIQAFCEGVRKIVYEHPKTRKDDIRVYVDNFGSSSIDIDFTCFITVHNKQDIHEEKAAREELILDILCLAEKLGVSFAFPSQTSYLIPAENPAYESAKKISGYAGAGQFGKETADEVLRDRHASPTSLPGPWPHDFPEKIAG